MAKKNYYPKITLIFILILMVSCHKSHNKEYLFSVEQKNGTGWHFTYTFLKCDSATMISQKEAIAWIDGTKIRVFADQITITSNTYIR